MFVHSLRLGEHRPGVASSSDKATLSVRGVCCLGGSGGGWIRAGLGRSGQEAQPSGICVARAKAPQAEQLKQRNSLASQFWSLEIQNQGAGRADPF